MKKSVTWLKGLSMILIVISHMYTVSGVKPIYSFCDDLGRLGVIFFIAISGVAYGLRPEKVYQANSWVDIVNHIKKKIKPLYPLYLIFLIIMFVLRMIVEGNKKWLIIEFIVSIPLLQSFVPYKTIFAYSLNTPMWYLSMMIILWGGVPLTKKISEIFEKKKIHWSIAYICLLCMILFISKMNIDIDWKR